MTVRRIRSKINGIELGELVVDEETKTVLMPCPKCHKTDKVKEILYGYITDNYDDTKYVPGGCVPAKDQYYCERDDLEY